MKIKLEKWQIDAALEIYNLAKGWQVEDQIMQQLREEDRNLENISITRVKVLTINTYYSVRVPWEDVNDIAKHIVQAMPQRVTKTPVDFINHLVQGFRQKYVVFASKFAHFFISEDFPILDDLAEGIIQLHLGKREFGQGRKEVSNEKRYEVFYKQFSELKKHTLALYSKEELSGMENINKILDQYLWLAGLCEKLRQDSSANVDTEIKELHNSKDLETKKHFDRLFPYILQENQWIRIQVE